MLMPAVGKMPIDHLDHVRFAPRVGFHDFCRQVGLLLIHDISDTAAGSGRIPLTLSMASRSLRTHACAKVRAASGLSFGRAGSRIVAR